MSWKKEIETTEFRQAVMAEWIGTFMFLFATIGCVVFTQDGGITTARQLEVSLVFGGMITILVYIFGGISGANINPAVSLALAITRKITPARCVAYTVAQCLGAVCGAGMVRIMTPALFDKVDGGANEISKNATGQEALGVEFGCTFILVMVVMAATDPIRAKNVDHLGAVAPLVVGMAVTAAHFVAIPVDNCSINPARSFGVSVISGNWNDHAVFWFGPYLGAVAAGLVYTQLLGAEHVHPVDAKPLVDQDAEPSAPSKAAPSASHNGAKAHEAVSVESAQGADLNEWR